MCDVYTVFDVGCVRCCGVCVCVCVCVLCICYVYCADRVTVLSFYGGISRYQVLIVFIWDFSWDDLMCADTEVST